MICNESKSLIKQFGITHMIHQTEIHALPGSWVTIELNWTEFISHSVNPKGYKTTGYRRCEQRIIFYKIYKKHINNIGTKYKYTETIQDIGKKYNYTRNNKRLYMSINDKDSHGEGQMNTPECQIDTHHNMTKIYI